MWFKGLVTVLVLDTLFVVVSIPLILRKVPRNVVYGFRTLATLSDDFVWYEANAYFGRRLVVFSLVSAVAVLVLYSGQVVAREFFVPSTIAALAVPPLIAIVQTLRFMRSFKPRPSDTPPANTPR